MSDLSLPGAEALAVRPVAPPPRPLQRTGDASQAREAAVEFEAVFLSQMLQHMFAGIETDPMFGGGQAEEIYRSMMIEQFGAEMARSGGIGLADAVTRELLTLQEA